MAAPTKPAHVKKVLANSEPSTHGTKQTSNHVRSDVCFRSEADMDRGVRPADSVENDPKQTSSFDTLPKGL